VAVDLFGGDGRRHGGVYGHWSRLQQQIHSISIWLFTYIFRGTPLMQLLVFYSGMYTLEIVKGMNCSTFFRSGLN
jgi:ABC-type arginine/histidine transport system permease subunit